MTDPGRRTRESHAAWRRLADTCVRLAGRAEVCEGRAPKVSAWSVGQQLEHLLRADRTILGAIDTVRDILKAV